MSSESLDNMIKTVVREHKWAPDKIDALFVDSEDYHGLIYWYDDVVHCIKSAEAKYKNGGS